MIFRKLLGYWSFFMTKIIMQTISTGFLIFSLTTVNGKPMVPYKVAILGGVFASCAAALTVTYFKND